MRILARCRCGNCVALAPEHYAFASRNVPSAEGRVNLDRTVGEPEVVFVGFPQAAVTRRVAALGPRPARRIDTHRLPAYSALG